MATPWRRAKRRKYADPEEQSVQHKEFPNEGLLSVISKYVAGGEAAVFSVKGYSMRPFLEHLRDKVELSPFTELQVGDAVLAEISPGHYVLHRIIVRDGTKLTLKGDGNLQGVEHCTVDDVRGVVTKYIRPGGHVLMADDPKLKRKIKLWGKLPSFFRRMYLFIYRQTI
jgi:hypothetical protein